MTEARRLWLCLLACSCSADPGPGEPGGDRPDATAIGDAAGEVSCDPARMENVIAEREILEGDFCDVIELCAGDADQAAAIAAIEPGFSCLEPRGCEPGEIACQWNTPDVLDAGEYARLCAISSLEDAPLLRCWVFL